MIAVPPLGGEGGQEGAEEEVISGSLEVIGFKSRRKVGHHPHTVIVLVILMARYFIYSIFS